METILFLVLFLVTLTFFVKSSFGGDKALYYNQSHLDEINEIISKLYNGDSWVDYRLGDVYLRYDKLYNPENKENVLYHKHKYMGSIANEYIHKNHTDKKNERLIKQIIESRTKNKNDYPDTLFLHIRVGDIFCVKTNKWVNKVGVSYYSKINDSFWWNNVLDYIKQNGITNVVIVSGLHKPGCLKDSAMYLIDRKNFLQKNRLKVSYRLGNSPDEDLLLCYYVKHFVTTGGGYGNLINEIKLK